MGLIDMARTKVSRTGEKSWWETLTLAQRKEILAELKKWDGPLTPFAKAVIEKFKIDRRVPVVRDTLRAVQNGKSVI